MEELSSITVKHVMAESEYNLENTRHATLKLSKGNLHELKRLVKCAKRDFSDVIYWASLALNSELIAGYSIPLYFGIPAAITQASIGPMSSHFQRRFTQAGFPFLAVRPPSGLH